MGKMTAPMSSENAQHYIQQAEAGEGTWRDNNTFTIEADIGTVVIPEVDGSFQTPVFEIELPDLR